MKTGRGVSAVFTLCFLGLCWLTYANVYSDLEPIKVASEAAACTVRDCKLRHGLTQITREIPGVELDYRWEAGTVITTCRRASYVVGPWQCDAK